MKILKRRNKKPLRPTCPVHGLPMLVRCVVEFVQYRYCQVEGCRESTQTMRKKSTHRRKRREEASPAEADTTNVCPP